MRLGCGLGLAVVLTVAADGWADAPPSPSPPPAAVGQDVAPASVGPLPPDAEPGKLAADDPRKGPRLEYKRGPIQCVDEATFRKRVMYWGDGVVDRLAAESPDVIRVVFERAPRGRYRAVVTYTDAEGKSAPPQTVTRDGDQCAALAWWTALVVSERVPKPLPPPPPAPCPQPSPCPPCAVPTCAPCPACAAPKPKLPPWYEGSMIGVYGLVLLTGGLFAEPGAAFGLGVDLRGKAPDDPWIPTYSFGLEGRFALPGKVYAREQIDPDLPTYPESFDVGQITALFVGCARWKYLSGCGVVQGGTYFIGTDGKFLSNSEAAFALGPRLGVRFPLGEHFALFGFGEALFAPVRIGFAPGQLPDGRYPNVQWLPSVVQGYGAAGVEFLFE